MRRIVGVGVRYLSLAMHRVPAIAAESGVGLDRGVARWAMHLGDVNAALRAEPGIGLYWSGARRARDVIVEDRGTDCGRGDLCRGCRFLRDILGCFFEIPDPGQLHSNRSHRRAGYAADDEQDREVRAGLTERFSARDRDERRDKVNEPDCEENPAADEERRAILAERVACFVVWVLGHMNAVYCIEI